MNTLKKNLLIVAITVIATTSVLGLFAFKNKIPEGGKEIVIVSSLGNGEITVNANSQEPEYIVVKALTCKERYSDRNKKLNVIFQKLYSQGFHMETSSGGDNSTNYIFVK